VDGEALYEVAHNIPDVSMYLLANLAMGGDWAGSPDETTPASSSLDIDYIRVYQNEAGILHGGVGDDSLSKSIGDMDGEAGNDTLVGGNGDNTLVGGLGNDQLVGGTGNDQLIGVDTDQGLPGIGEVDTLVGGDGQDTFVLGANGQVYYDDGDSLSDGVADHAMITDFNMAEDVIQLVGSALDYRLGSGTQGTATEIWHQASGAVDELVAVVAQATITNFDQGFTFV
jgi:Ca2+-binding RTX toxin-like protein